MTEVVVVDSGEKTAKKRRLWLWLPLGIIIILAIATGGFVFWAVNPFVPIDDIALNALESSDNITVTDRAWLAFLPHEPPETGIIFYPGARVPAEAYAPIARQLAEDGYLAVIVYPPINLAIFNRNLATPVMEHFSAIDNWVVGGHSLGGSVAANYAAVNTDTVQGVFLLGTYTSDDSLKTTDQPVLSIYGTNDGLSTVEEINEARSLLPDDTVYVSIEGGNHAQFGYYGTQAGDNPATISRDVQIEQTITAISDFAEQITQ